MSSELFNFDNKEPEKKDTRPPIERIAELYKEWLGNSKEVDVHEPDDICYAQGKAQAFCEVLEILKEQADD